MITAQMVFSCCFFRRIIGNVGYRNLRGGGTHPVKMPSPDCRKYGLYEGFVCWAIIVPEQSIIGLFKPPKKGSHLMVIFHIPNHLVWGRETTPNALSIETFLVKSLDGFLFAGVIFLKQQSQATMKGFIPKGRGYEKFQCKRLMMVFERKGVHEWLINQTKRSKNILESVP